MSSWTDAARRIDVKVQVQWGANWIDESARVKSVDGAWAMPFLWQLLGPAAGGVQPQSARVVLYNDDNRYSASNAGSPIRSYVGNTFATDKGYGTPVRISVSQYDNGGSGFAVYDRIFTGYIDSLTPSSLKRREVVVNCIDNSHPLLQKKTSTTLYSDKRTDEFLSTLATEGGVASTDFERGLQVIPYAWLDDENILSEMQAVAAAEGGYLYFAADGTLNFRNLEAWIANTEYTVSQVDFTVNDFYDVSLPFDWNTIYNRTQVVYSPRVPIGEQVVWTLPRARTILPGETITIIARHKYPITGATYEVLVQDGNGNDQSTDVDITQASYAQRTTFELENTSAREALLLGLSVSGAAIGGQPNEQVQVDATDSDIGSPASNAKTLRVDGNLYLQTEPQATFLAQPISDRLKVGRQMYTVQGRGYPDLEPGYYCTITEAGSGLSDNAYIQAINWNLAGGSYRATYQLINADSWLPYSNYYEFSSSVLNGSARLFY